MDFDRPVEIVDVGLRDGLQSLERTYPTEVKVRVAGLLTDAGLRRIEITSFVRPDVVPQLADAEELLRALPRREGCLYRALAPNVRGVERAIAAGVDEILGLVTASETYNRLNQGMSIEQSLQAVKASAELAGAHGIHFVVGIGLAMFCPYEGDVPIDKALRLVERVRDSGVHELYVATTVGCDAPAAVHRLCAAILRRWPGMRIGVHLHNTNGMALANALAAYDAGATVFEGSICGIGGGIRMPSGMAHHGNVATEDLVHMFADSGVATGIDLERLSHAAAAIRDVLELDTVFSSALAGGTKQAVRERARQHTDPAA